MNRNYVLIALLAAAPALVNDIDPFGLEKDHFTSDRSRSQVVAGTKHAQTSSHLYFGHENEAPVCSVTCASIEEIKSSHCN